MLLLDLILIKASRKEIKLEMPWFYHIYEFNVLNVWVGDKTKMKSSKKNPENVTFQHSKKLRKM